MSAKGEREEAERGLAVADGGSLFGGCFLGRELHIDGVLLLGVPLLLAGGEGGGYLVEERLDVEARLGARLDEEHT